LVGKKFEQTYESWCCEQGPGDGYFLAWDKQTNPLSGHEVHVLSVR
jgi:hypothetical protein